MEVAIRAKRVTIWKVFMVEFYYYNILCIKNGVMRLGVNTVSKRCMFALLSFSFLGLLEGVMCRLSTVERTPDVVRVNDFARCRTVERGIK